MNCMATCPVLLFFFKTSLKTQVGGYAELYLLRRRSKRKTNKQKRYGNVFVQRDKTVCNVTELNAAVK